MSAAAGEEPSVRSQEAYVDRKCSPIESEFRVAYRRLTLGRQKFPTHCCTCPHGARSPTMLACLRKNERQAGDALAKDSSGRAVRPELRGVHLSCATAGRVATRGRARLRGRTRPGL